MKSQTDCSGVLKLRMDSEGWVLAETMKGVRMPGTIKGEGQETRCYKGGVRRSDTIRGVRRPGAIKGGWVRRPGAIRDRIRRSGTIRGGQKVRHYK